MIDWLQIVILALIQGVTEFLPVSSSAHLLLPSEFLGWPDQGLAFDISVHAGTLCAVVFYFRQTLFGLARASMPDSGLDRTECWALIIATLPVLAAGFLLKELIADEARTVVVIKRSLAPGYAGIKNPLFDMDNCLMVFLDAKEALEGMVKEVKELAK